MTNLQVGRPYLLNQSVLLILTIAVKELMSNEKHEIERILKALAV